ERRGRPARVLAGFVGAAAAWSVGVRAAPGYESHPHADDILAALAQQGGRDGRVDSAAHRDDDLPAPTETAAASRRRTTLGGNAQRDSEADDAGDVLRPGATALLLPAPGLHRREARAAAHVERPDALRPIELVRVHGDQVHGDATGVEVEGADGLDRIAVELHASVTADRADLGDRLDGADLV